jgi:hypothetical protein
MYFKNLFNPYPSKKRKITNKYYLVDKEGISLCTESKRMQKVDKWLIAYLRERTNYIFGDFGASSGITTLNFHETAIKANKKIQSHIIDRALSLKRYSKFPFSIFKDSSEHSIQFFFLNIPLTYLNSNLARFFKIKKIIEFYITNKKRFYTGKFSIVDDNIQKFNENNKINKIYLNEMDFTIFNPKLENKFNLIRIAHALDYLYRNDQKKLFIFFNYIKKYLQNNGYLLLIVNNTNATLIIKKNNKFFIERRYRNGAKEIESFLISNGLISELNHNLEIEK